MTRGDKLTLIDFGISCKFSFNLKQKGYRSGKGERGTEGYMAPEVRSGKKFNSKIDMWGVGIMLLEWVTLLL